MPHIDSEFAKVILQVGITGVICVMIQQKVVYFSVIHA